MSLDTRVENWLAKQRLKSPFCDVFFYFCAKYMIVVLGVLLTGVVFFLTHFSPLHAQVLLYVLMTSWGVTLVIEVIVGRKRPFTHHHAHPFPMFWTPTPSFPSAHSAVAFAFAGYLYCLLPSIGIFGIILAVLVAMGRVYVGVHYVTDVLAGMIIGLSVTYVFCDMLVHPFL